MARRESQATISSHQRLPLLRNAKREEVDACKEYKSGASYKGQVYGHDFIKDILFLVMINNQHTGFRGQLEFSLN